VCVSLFVEPSSIALLANYDIIICFCFSCQENEAEEDNEGKGTKKVPWDDFPTLYTDPKNGQKLMGGWSQEGMKRYKALLDLVNNIIAADQKRDFQNEKKCLSKLKEKHGLTAQQEQGTRRNKRQKATCTASSKEKQEMLEVPKELMELMKIGQLEQSLPHQAPRAAGSTR
jgi:hypothetical protein